MVGEKGWRRNATLALFVLPSLIPLVMFTLGPMAASAWISLQKWNLLAPMQFIGLDNYTKLLTDPRTGEVFLHTVYYIVGYLPLVYVGGLGLALRSTRGCEGRSFAARRVLPAGRHELGRRRARLALAAEPAATASSTRCSRFFGIAGPGWWTDPGVGHAVGHPRLGLEGPRLRHGDPARRPAGDQPGPVRGRQARRRGRLAPAVQRSRCRCCRRPRSSCS